MPLEKLTADEERAYRNAFSRVSRETAVRMNMNNRTFLPWEGRPTALKD
jgi:hypothetical protein